MAENTQSRLYSPRLLALSASLAGYPFDPTLPFQAETRSRTCGSVIALGLATNAAGQVTRIGMQVSACAVGQSSAAILASDVSGRTGEDIANTYGAIQNWLAGAADLPGWPGLDALEPAKPHTGRHGALLLPWKAACEALSSAPGVG